MGGLVENEGSKTQRSSLAHGNSRATLLLPSLVEWKPVTIRELKSLPLGTYCFVWS